METNQETSPAISFDELRATRDALETAHKRIAELEEELAKLRTYEQVLPAL